MTSFHVGLTALLLATAIPSTAAQFPSPATADGQLHGGNPHAGNPLLESMSPAGRETMRTLFKSPDPEAGKAAVAAARDRWLGVLDAERLDPSALKRAMDDEREAANTAKARQQTALLGALEQLSLPDRRAFVANSRAIRARVEAMAAERKAAEKARQRGPGDFNQPLPQ